MPKDHSKEIPRRTPVQLDDGTWVFARAEHRWEQQTGHCQQLLDKILPLLRDRTEVVQAGGHIGAWPFLLSKHFKTVWTFEADVDNYRLLAANLKLKNAKNIYSMRAALFERTGQISMQRTKSTVSNYVIDKPGKIHATTIDAIELSHCAAILLDIEGAEAKALRGARKTIKKFHPMVVVEDKGHGTNRGHGTTWKDIMAELEGYAMIETSKSDKVLVWRK